MTSPLLIINGTAILPDRLVPDAAILCRDGLITNVGTAKKARIPRDAEIVDARGGYISPGFVDIHVHGGDGADFMDGTPDAVRTAIRAHTRHGTTSIFPTTTTGSPAQLDAMLKACATVQREWKSADGARLAGVHFTGRISRKTSSARMPRKAGGIPSPRNTVNTSGEASSRSRPALRN